MVRSAKDVQGLKILNSPPSERDSSNNGFELISLLFITTINFVPANIPPIPLTTNFPSSFYTLPAKPFIIPLALILFSLYFLPI